MRSAGLNMFTSLSENRSEGEGVLLLGPAERERNEFASVSTAGTQLWRGSLQAGFEDCFPSSCYECQQSSSLTHLDGEVRHSETTSTREDMSPQQRAVAAKVLEAVSSAQGRKRPRKGLGLSHVKISHHASCSSVR